MLKRLLLILAVMLVSHSASATGYMGIVDRSATRDTLPFQFAFLDSVDNNVTGAAGDSIYLFITDPGGDEVYRDSTLLAGVTAIAPEDQPSVYVWAEQVSVLDGSSTDEGIFSYSIIAVDISLSLRSYYNGSFQIINGQTLDGTLDSILAAIARLDNIQVATDSTATAIADANKGNFKYAVTTEFDSLETAVADANKGNFKYAVTTEFDSLETAIADANKGNFKATGFSTFDNTSDSVIVDISTGNVANGLFAVTADSVWARATRTLTVADWSTHSAADVWAVVTRALTDKSDFALTTSERALIADSVWGADTTGFTAGGTQGYANTHGTPASIGAGDIVAIADTIFHRDSADVNDGAATSFGTLLMKPAYVQGAAAGLDSTVLSNVLYRVVYGIPKGSGSDSTTLAQRKMTVAAIVNDIITAASIATDAIGSDELAATAVDEIVDNTWDELVSGHSTALTYGDTLPKMLQELVDTAEAQDDWVAKEATVALLPDTTDIKTMLLNNLFARLSQDTVIEISVAGNVVIASINADGDTIARFKDSTSFQGEAGSLTVQSIVDGVWDELQSAHTTASTFGKYLDTEVSGVSSPAGSGAFTVTWILLDTTATPDTTVAIAPLYVNNVAQSSTPLFQLTDNNGQASFNLDAGTWVIFTTEPGYSSNVDTFTISGVVTDTLMVYQTTGDLTSVAFDLRQNNGVFFASSKVRIELVSKNDSILYYDDKLIFTPWVVEDTANSSGLAVVPLYPNDLFTNDSTWYNITIYDKRKRKSEKFRVRVPVSDSVVYVQNLPLWNRGH